jgi:hypothetical protein
LTTVRAAGEDTPRLLRGLDLSGHLEILKEKPQPGDVGHVHELGVVEDGIQSAILFEDQIL